MSTYTVKTIYIYIYRKVKRLMPCSLVGAGAGLGWLVLVFCERKTLLAGWFGLAETNKRTGSGKKTLVIGSGM